MRTINNYINELPLDEQAAAILGITPPKHRTYDAIIRRYEKLALENDWTNENKTIWPISKDNLTKYITYLHPRVAPQTIISYLSVLKHHHTINQLDWDN